MPIGDGAKLTKVGFQPGTVTIEEDILILDAKAPIRDVKETTASWSGADRCGAATGNTYIGGVPIPSGFTTNGYIGGTPNHSGAILKADGRTVINTQPLHVCSDSLAVSQFWKTEVDIMSNDPDSTAQGAHGGSGLSSIGGTIRTKEFFEKKKIPHALKINLWADKYLGPCTSEAGGGMWPAKKADSYCASYKGSNPFIKMGSLVTLPKDFNMSGLSEPTRIVAEALRDYGAYLVDDTARDAYALAIEWSPESRFIDVFQKTYGYGFEDAPFNTELSQKVFTELMVVENNGPNNVGGGGTLRAPKAPPFCQ